jgi:Type ISP C-terminal specificity domain/N-6 DNA Methylase
LVEDTFLKAISAFGAAAKAKLANKAATGAPEDQLRTPVQELIKDLAAISGIPSNKVECVGESTVSELSTRPDYAVTVHNALIGFVEIKAPGKGADPTRFKDDHDKKQWAKLKSLPNLLYTDGNSFSVWRDGKIEGKVLHLEGDIESAGSKLSAPQSLLGLISDFLRWNPIPPKSAKKLAEISARLCRYLRDEVTEELKRNNPGLTSLAREWRHLLFPDASDEQFADGYAQAVTFGLLVARVRDVDLSAGLDTAANELRKTSTLIGTALRLLIDNADVKEALKTSLDTLRRVLNTVSWPAISKDNANAWLYFYEDFLEVYDNDLRKKTGSYYTPPEVVNAMVRLTDEALRDPELFNRPKGLADANVTICDPAIGTGTFLLGVLRKIATTIETDQGAGAVKGAIEAASKRIFGFEMQFGPFAVAQLRLIAEFQSLLETMPGAKLPEAQLFVTDTLGDPYAQETQFSAMVAPIGESRKRANKVKRDVPITVVIGNPPYKNKAEGLGGWIEKGSNISEETGSSTKKPSAYVAAPLDWWSPPVEWKLGAHGHHLKNLYIYFWRWAALKVFGSGWKIATGYEPKEESGIVCFITVAGFLNGPGFQKMREELRRDCDAIWVIDCSPEGHQPEVNTRIFEGVQQPVCIVIAARTKGKDRSTPAQARFTALPSGHRRQVKFPALEALSLAHSDWQACAKRWRDPFLPEANSAWTSFPALAELFDWSGPGVTAHRTWPISPDPRSLERRWAALQSEPNPEKRAELFDPDDDRNIDRRVKAGFCRLTVKPSSVRADRDHVTPPVRYAFRSFDRQYLIPDHRLISRARPLLWDGYSAKQVYITALERASPTNGPVFTLTGLVPDLDHYKGRGGRVYPLWRNADATIPNVKADLVAHLSTIYGREVRPEDVMAYLAAVMAHCAFTARFQKDLIRPGLRVPLTADAGLFGKAVAVGSEVIWLHTYGERFADPAAGRPASPPRLPQGHAPFFPSGGGIPGAPEPLPDTMIYNAAERRLVIGKGHVDNVPPEVGAYEVSGMNVLRQWFSYRKRDRRRPIIGDRRPPSPLSFIQPEHWLAEYTDDLN